MAVLRFKKSEVRRIVDHLTTSKTWGADYGQKVGKPAVVFVHDQGLYLMSNGEPADIVDPAKGTRFVAYAEGFDPSKVAFDEWWEGAREIVGGDDFGIHMGPDPFRAAMADPGEWVLVDANKRGARVVRSLRPYTPAVVSEELWFPGDRVEWTGRATNATKTGTIQSTRGLRYKVVADSDGMVWSVPPSMLRKTTVPAPSAPAWRKGQRVEFDSERAGKVVTGTVAKLLGALVQVDIDGGHQYVKIAPTQLRPTATPAPTYTGPTFFPGSRVTFTAKGRTVVGTVTRIGQRMTVSVECDDGTRWSGVRMETLRAAALPEPLPAPEAPVEVTVAKSLSEVAVIGKRNAG